MNNRMLTAILLIFATLSGAALAATIYKKVNTDGSVEYSDQPFAGAKQFETTKHNQTNLPRLRRQQPAAVQSKSQSLTTAITTDYAISIQSPSPQQAIRSNNGDLSIVVQTTPVLTSKLKIQLFVSGAPHGQPTQDTVFKLENVNRGEVKIKAQLIGNHGNVLATSPETIVYLHRAVVRQVN